MRTFVAEACFDRCCFMVEYGGRPVDFISFNLALIEDHKRKKTTASHALMPASGYLLGIIRLNLWLPSIKFHRLTLMILVSCWFASRPLIILLKYISSRASLAIAVL